MKRFLAILLVLTLALCCFISCGNDDANDANGTETDTDKAPAYESRVEVAGGTIELQTQIDGETLYASVVIDGNPGIAGFVLDLQFDNTKCVVREFTASDIIDYEMITSNIQQSEDKSAFTNASAMWAVTSDVVSDGVLFTLAFDIIDASAEDFGFNLICGEDAFTNQNLEAVRFTVK